MQACGVFEAYTKKMYNDQSDSFWTISTFGNFSVPEFAAKAYAEVLPYVKKFLTAPHPHRKGVSVV